MWRAFDALPHTTAALARTPSLGGRAPAICKPEGVQASRRPGPLQLILALTRLLTYWPLWSSLGPSSAPVPRARPESRSQDQPRATAQELSLRPSRRRASHVRRSFTAIDAGAPRAPPSIERRFETSSELFGEKPARPCCRPPQRIAELV